MQQSFLDRLNALANEVALREGCEIYDLEFTPQRILRVTIDKTPGPVGVDDCANVSRGINLMLDVEDIIPGGAYQLEVSSPGLERTLKKPAHFAKAVGQKVVVRLNQAVGPLLGLSEPRWEKAKQLQGLLKAQSEAGIEVEAEGGSFQLPWTSLEKVKTVFEYGPAPMPGKGKKK